MQILVNRPFDEKLGHFQRNSYVSYSTKRPSFCKPRCKWTFCYLQSLWYKNYSYRGFVPSSHSAVFLIRNGLGSNNAPCAQYRHTYINYDDARRYLHRFRHSELDRKSNVRVNFHFVVWHIRFVTAYPIIPSLKTYI